MPGLPAEAALPGGCGENAAPRAEPCPSGRSPLQKTDHDLNCFPYEKLKERLVKIMTYKTSFAHVLAAVSALALLAGCAAGTGPADGSETPAGAPSAAPAQTTAPSAPSGTADPSEPPTTAGEIRVTNVDEFLDAIAPNTTIVLAKGDYDLSTARNYGKTPRGAHYDWDAVGDPGEYELLISFVNNLTIRGEDAEATRVLIQPRFANVILFSGCRDLSVESLTVGHTDGSYCSGGVLRLEKCENVSVRDCDLFGCGTIAVWGSNCRGIRVEGSRIYECSVAAVSVAGCHDVRVEDCEVYRHGLRGDVGTATSLFDASDTDGFAVCNNRVYENAAQYLLSCSRTRNAFFLSNDVHDNRLDDAVFSLQMYSCVVDGCAFTDNDRHAWTLRLDPVSPDGTLLDSDMLESMTLHDSDPDMPFPAVEAESVTEVEPGGTVTVLTVDDFLRAIGPERTIVLEGELFDLSAASSYGKIGTEYYCWQESYDGPELMIQNVQGLTILASSEDATATTISAEPRFANVLCFRNCSEITLVGFTAGHTKEPGACAGGVLSLEDCHDVEIDRCRLFGCGILGVKTSDCADISLKETEIYECSQGAGEFHDTDGISFLDCNIHDVPSPHFRFFSCSDLSWNGETFSGRDLDVGEDGKLTSPQP